MRQDRRVIARTILLMDRPRWSPSYLSVLLVFGMLAFSGDLVRAADDLASEVGADLDGWKVTVLAVSFDALLIAALWATRQTRRPGTTPAVTSWLIVAALFLLIDVVRSTYELSPLADIAWLMLYLPLLVMLFAYSRGHRVVGPVARHLRRKPPATGDELLWEAILPALPLIAGAGAAWTAAVLWVDQFDLRSESGLEAGVSPEFFAQVSQIIPVLLLALLFEARLLRIDRQGSTRWTLNMYVVLVLVVAECMVLSALPMSNDTQDGNGILLTDWHEYLAFDLGVYAVVVALSALVVLVGGGLAEEPKEPLPVRVVS